MITTLDSSKSYYELLGVPNTADASALRSAFCRLTKTLHPDTTSLPPKEAALRFQEVLEAYELLADPSLRAAYDADRDRIVHDTSGNNQTSSKNIKTLLDHSKVVDVRRPFSGGELFSLLLLVLSLFLSIVLALVFSVIQGRELQSPPIWLTPNQTQALVLSGRSIDGPSFAT